MVRLRRQTTDVNNEECQPIIANVLRKPFYRTFISGEILIKRRLLAVWSGYFPVRFWVGELIVLCFTQLSTMFQLYPGYVTRTTGLFILKPASQSYVDQQTWPKVLKVFVWQGRGSSLQTPAPKVEDLPLHHRGGRVEEASMNHLVNIFYYI